MGGADTMGEILDDCDVEAAALKPILEHLSAYLERYLPHFKRSEHRTHATIFVEGLLSDLDRKSIEPIATRRDQERRRLQHFVGAGRWDDEALLNELRRHVAEELGDPRSVLVIDGSSFPKRGSESVGVKRPWDGRGVRRRS